MIASTLFLTLVLTLGSISAAPNLLNESTTWQSPKRFAGHRELYKRTNESKLTDESKVTDESKTTDASTKFDPDKVIKAMGKMDDTLRILTAHRGIAGPKCPENSRCSVLAAVAAGIESVELDVYSDKDGVLWPIHDLRIGRVTNYRPLHSPEKTAGRYFDPHHDAPKGINNPLISTVDYRTLQFLHLRDNDGLVVDQYFEELKTILILIRSLGVLAVVLDMRTKNDIITAVRLIQSLAMTTMVAFKFPVDIINPYASEIDLLGGIAFIPVQYPGQAEVIAFKHPLFLTDNNGAVTYFDIRYTRYANFLYFEPSTKMFKYSDIVGWIADGPMDWAHNALLKKRIPLGTYILSPNVPQGYFDPNGHCCGQPYQWLFNSYFFGDETRDDRGELEPSVNMFNVLTCDNIIPVLKIATDYGYRDGISKILQ